MNKLIYIAGYGRSGSTLLDVLLANTDQAFGGGELHRLFRVVEEGAPCTCGSLMRECPLWSEVLDGLSDEVDDFSVKTAAVVTRDREKALSDPGMAEEYRVIWTSVLKHLGDRSGLETLVDSSKVSRHTANRIEALADIVPDVRVIHLTRHPQAVLWSVHRDYQRRNMHAMHPRNVQHQARSTVGWMIANQMTERIQRRTRIPVLQVRYEDLAKDPVTTMQRICEHCDLDFGALRKKLEQGTGFSSGHGVWGNRMRRSGEIKIRYDDEWEHNNLAMVKGLSLLARPMSRKYGYNGTYIGSGR